MKFLSPRQRLHLQDVVVSASKRPSHGHGKAKERKDTGPDLVERCKALVLDGSFRPTGVVNWHRAIILDVFKAAEVLEYYDCFVTTVREEYPIPAVLRTEFVLKSAKQLRVPMSKRNVLRRDRHRCLYCGHKGSLTIDHVVPLSKGGDHSWENLATACLMCNNRKGNRTLEQLGWTLQSIPRKPTLFDYHVKVDLPHNRPKEWEDYIAYLEKD